MSLKYRTSAGTSASDFTDLVVKVGDTLPIGTEVDYDGQTAPAGWQEVSETNLGDVVVDSIRTKNLFDKNRLWNAWINTQGNLVESASNRASDYIDIHGMSHITISGSTTITVVDAFYDSSKTFVSYVEVSTETATLQVPNNAYYIRVTVKPAALDTYQIEEGSTATPYKPHQELNNQEVYSTGETKIGTFLGKPLYRKVINAGTPSISSGGTISIAHNISNIGILKSVEATLVANNYTNQYPIPYISGSRNTSISNVTTTNVIIQSTSESWSGHTLYIILEYTKTTD